MIHNKNIINIAESFYLDWLNDYLTVKLIAEHNCINEKLAMELIILGKKVNNKTYIECEE